MAVAVAVEVCVALAVTVTAGVGVDVGDGSVEGVAVGVKVGVEVGVRVGVGPPDEFFPFFIRICCGAKMVVPPCFSSAVTAYSPGANPSRLNVVTEEVWVG